MTNISVLIVTYNSSDTIKECLESLEEQVYGDFEIILVDNNSKDNTRAIIDEFRKKSSILLKTEFLNFNSGFCQGNNIGYKSAVGNYIALLNPDAKADQYWLMNLVSMMERNSDVGICASKVLIWNGQKIDSAGDILLCNFRVFKRGEGQNWHEFDSPSLIFGACGAGAIYRKEMLDRIGFFDEDFFIQCEDSDLSFRAHLAGWKVFYEPSAKIYHKVSSSIGKASEICVYYTHRNIEFLRIKNVPSSVLLIFTPQIMIGLIVDFLYFGIKRRKWRVFLKAKIDAIKMIPQMLKKRKKIMKEIRVDNTYVRSLISPINANDQLIILKLKKFTDDIAFLKFWPRIFRIEPDRRDEKKL